MSRVGRPRKPGKKVVVPARISPDIAAALGRLGEREDRSKSWLIDHLLRERLVELGELPTSEPVESR